MLRVRPRLNVAALRRVIQRHPEILAAYLYGSYATGRPNRQSDVDIAVVLREQRGRLATEPNAAYEVDLANELGTAIGHARVEVVILNDAPPLLAWEAVRRGRRIFARDVHAVRRFELRTRQRYLDTAHLRAIQDHYLQRIVDQGFSRAVGR
jgi:predicted nucleotidyltransferase